MPMTYGRDARADSACVELGVRGEVTRWVALCALALLVLLALPGIDAFATSAPHVVDTDTPEACAMCHRTHTAAGVVGRTAPGSWDTTGSALVLSVPGAGGDTALCYTCHGIDTLGSGTNVQGAFTNDSAHRLAPEDSAFGPSPKQCSSCHDAHGTARNAADAPFAALLRSSTSDGTKVFSAEEYCATCHYEQRADNRFRGLEVYSETPHAGLDVPSSGTEITCLICHEAHGSAFAPLIRSEILPSAAPATATVEANDRTLCYACHAEADTESTWVGGTLYDTASSHGLSAVEVASLGEWASEETTRAVGECQSCHNPMGREDGRGGVIDALADAEGRELCYRCHDGEVAETDFRSMAVPADLEGNEVVIAYDPPILPHAYSTLQVYTREDGGASLEGPRRYLPDAPGARSGSVAVAYGGIDGLGGTGEYDLLVGDPGSPGRLHVYSYDKLAGLAPTPYSLDETATLVAAGDFLTDEAGSPEVAVVSVDADGASNLRLYRHDGANGLASVQGPFPVGYDATGIAGGELGVGVSASQLVVTARSAEATDTPWAVYVVSQADTDTVDLRSFSSTHPGIRGPSIGPVLAGGEPGIVVANADALPQTISVYAPDSTGTPAATHLVYGASGARPWDTVVGPFLPGNEQGVAVAVRNETGMNALSMFEIGSAGLSALPDVTTGEHFATSALAVGDVNGDGTAQVVIANAGFFSRDAKQSVSPSVQSLRWNGSAFVLVGSEPLWAGGVELAGGTPGIAVADLGPVGRSRHPASAIPGAHDSVEEEGFARHAECIDCHNVHVSDDSTATAPAVYGVLKGSWGYDWTTKTLKKGVEYEYETCFKCHGPREWADSPRDVSREFDAAANGSVHPVTTGTGDRIYCIDCHGNADSSQPSGPHTSPASPLLSSAVIGIKSQDAEMLCYGACHDIDVYRDGSAGTSAFYDATTDVQLHARHVSDFGLSCQTCHTNHGSVNRYLVREDVDWVDASPNGGACFTQCHLGSTANAYSRIEQELGPVAVAAPVNNGVTGAVGALQARDDGLYYVVNERQGTPALRVEIDFTGVTSTPVSFRIWGHFNAYGVALGHNVNVEAWNYTTSAWEIIGTMPKASIDGLYTYPIANAAYVSPAPQRQLRIRIDHTSGGHQNHKLWLDRVWLQF